MGLKRVTEKLLAGMNHTYDTKFITVRFGMYLVAVVRLFLCFVNKLKQVACNRYRSNDTLFHDYSRPLGGTLNVLGMEAKCFFFVWVNRLKIVDLAKNMIRLSGLEPNRDIRIEFTELCPGEKLYEELLTSEEENEYYYA